MSRMTNIMMFLITIKFQFIQTILTDKEDYFNHKDYELPEFIADESLFTTENNLRQNQPWITIKATSMRSPAPLSKSVTTTPEIKLKNIQPLPLIIEVTKSSKNNVFQTPLPFWSRVTHKLPVRVITEDSTTFSISSTTNSTNGATTTSTISYLITLTPKSTTKPTTRATLKPNTNSSAISTIASTSSQFSTITAPVLTTSSPTTKKLVPTTPTQPTTTRSWFFYLTTKTKPKNITTAVKTIPIATVTVAAATSKSTEKPIDVSNITAVTNPTTEDQYIEAILNKVRPQNPTIATISTAFQDLTMIRNGLLEEGKPEPIDKLNQAAIKPNKSIFMDEREKIRNSLRDKEVIEYKELTTEPFSKFLELLIQELSIMDSGNAAKFLRTFERQMGVLINMGKFDALGPAIIKYILDAFKRFQFPIDQNQRLLSMAHNMLANRNDTLRPELNSILDYMDMLYAVKTEVDMERVLNETIAYPNISKTAEEITEGFIEDILLNPLKRISGTTQGNKLLGAIAELISYKNEVIKARRAFTREDEYPKRCKELNSLHKLRKDYKRRPKVVLVKNNRKGYFVDEYGRKGTWSNKQEGRQRMTIAFRSKDGDIKNYIINSNEQGEVRSAFKINEITKSDALNVVNRGERKLTEVSKNSNIGKKLFRASFDTFKQNNNKFNPFRTLLYKNNNERFENFYIDKETFKPYYLSTTPTAKATEFTMLASSWDKKKERDTSDIQPPSHKLNFYTSRDKKKENYIYDSQTQSHKSYFYTSQDKKEENNTFDIQQPSHESSLYHKRKEKNNKKVNKDTIEHFVRESLKSELNTYRVANSKSNETANDLEVTTITRHSLRQLKSISKNKPKTTGDTKTTRSEFREANISLKHFYFKPVIIVNKTGDNDDFVSIEFDAEPNFIEFSMKVKLKNPNTKPTTHKESDIKNATETSTPPNANPLRVLNPYKMDDYFKNNGTNHTETGTKSDKESSTDSNSSSSYDSKNLEVSSDEERDSEPHVFGKLRKIENRRHKKQKLRSVKHEKSKKHHRRKKHERQKGHQRRGKHGNKRRHKFLQAHLKKKLHGRKKRILHKLKQLKNKRIVGKNFEIDFDVSSDGSEQNNLIDVTIVKRARYGKRPTISLINKVEKFKSSYSINSSEEEKRNHKTKNGKKSTIPTNHIKYKNRRTTNTPKATLKVETTVTSLSPKQILRHGDHTKEENTRESDHQQYTTVDTERSDSSDQEISDKSTLGIDKIMQMTLTQKRTTKKKTSPKGNTFKNLLKTGNKYRNTKNLSPMLIPVNKPKKVTNNKLIFSRNLKNKAPIAQRRFLPVLVFNNSEYSDEEDELKRNLYDAFRHQDELYYRRNMRHELPLKKDLREESDVTDEEIIFKQNIYKAIKGNERSNHE